MRRLLVALALLLFTGQAFAAPWSPVNSSGGSVALSVTNSTGSVALAVADSGGPAPLAYICNTGTNAAYVVLGGATVTATTASGFPVAPNNCYTLNSYQQTYLAAITASSTTTLTIASGSGDPGAMSSATGFALSLPLSVANGGTGAATFTAHGVMLGEGTSALVPTAAGTTGQLLQGATGGNPGWATALSGAYDFTNALVTFGNAAGVPTHIATAQQTAPALTSCGGGSPTITGTDEAGIVTMGTSATGCVITFQVAYTGTPFCVVSWIATPLASQSYVTSNVAITLTQTSTSSNKAQYICRAPAGG